MNLPTQVNSLEVGLLAPRLHSALLCGHSMETVIHLFCVRAMAHVCLDFGLREFGMVVKSQSLGICTILSTRFTDEETKVQRQ
jgi:hypothetical protein